MQRGSHSCIIVSDPELQAWGQSIAHALGARSHTLVLGTPLMAAEQLQREGIEPSELVIDIGARGADILPEIDRLADQCVPGTQVVVTGVHNDIRLYRELIARGVLEYVMRATSPGESEAAEIATIFRNHLQTASPKTTATAAPAVTSAGKRGQVIAFFAASSGDGASTVALNVAHAISKLTTGRTILIDMDYQFGMVARLLDLQTDYGIRELFENTDRGIDATLLARMVAKYGTLDVVTAPTDLHFMPPLEPAALEALLARLRENYDTIILDLPHVWQPWVMAACIHADRLVMVSQLWLKSVSHAARIMKNLRSTSLRPEHITMVINRAGAKFKEAVDEADFIRVCGVPIRHHISNDIRTIGLAEAQAKTMMELPPSHIRNEMETLAKSLISPAAMVPGEPEKPKSGGLFSALKQRHTKDY
jgi:pilus assembly protein CpaE